MPQYGCYAKEAAKILGTSEATLRQWRYRGTGPAYVKRGGRVIYLDEDLKTWDAGTRVSPTK